MLLNEDIESLRTLSHEQLVQECSNRRQLCEDLWTAVMVKYGPDGFNELLEQIKNKKQLEIEQQVYTQ